ncbi:MAG: SDR family NAD(P)-dependent oxidoreductase, partial [Pseudomonadota bacterium]
MNLNLNGKVALVTGGARDVGGDISKLLAEEGAKVAVNYNSSADEAEAIASAIMDAGGEAKAFGADISIYDQVNQMVDGVI